MEHNHTIFERDQTLVGDLELERVKERRRVVQHGDVGDVHSAHGRRRPENLIDSTGNPRFQRQPIYRPKALSRLSIEAWREGKGSKEEKREGENGLKIERRKLKFLVRSRGWASASLRMRGYEGMEEEG